MQKPFDCLQLAMLNAEKLCSGGQRAFGQIYRTRCAALQFPEERTSLANLSNGLPLGNSAPATSARYCRPDAGYFAAPIVPTHVTTRCSARCNYIESQLPHALTAFCLFPSRLLRLLLRTNPVHHRRANFLLLSSREKNCLALHHGGKDDVSLRHAKKNRDDV